MKHRFSARLISVTLSVLVVGCAMPVDEVSESQSALNLGGSFYPRPVPVPSPRLTISPTYEQTAENSMNVGWCRLLSDFEARLPYVSQTWQGMGMTRSEASQIQSHAASARSHACGRRVFSEDFLSDMLDLGRVLDRPIARLSIASGLTLDEAKVLWHVNTRFEVLEMMEQCGNDVAAPPGTADPEEPFGPSCDSPSDAVGSSNTQTGAACIQNAVAQVVACDSVVTDPEPDPEVGDDGNGSWTETEEQARDREAAKAAMENVVERLEELIHELEDSADLDTVIGLIASAMAAVIIASMVAAELPFAAMIGVFTTVGMGVMAGGQSVLNSTVTRQFEAIKRDMESRLQNLSGSGANDCPSFRIDGQNLGYANPESNSIVDFGALLAQCLCNAVEADSSGVELGPDTACGNSELNARRDCLLNPIGPDDGPRPECAMYLEEDNEPWEWTTDPGDAVCQVLACPSGTTSLQSDNGSCACFEPLPPAQDPSNHCAAVLCPSGQRAVPMPDGSCNCNTGLGDGFDFGGGFDLPSEPIPSPFPGPFPGF